MEKKIIGEKVIFNTKKEETWNGEYVLPEYLPGILRIIKVSVIFDRCEFSADEEKPYLSADAKIHILYLSDYSAELKSVTFDENLKLTFKEAFNYNDEYTAVPSLYASGLSATPLSGRKIKIKCTLHPACTVYALKETSLYLPEKDDGICVLNSNAKYCESFYIKSDALTTSTELTLEKTSPCAKDVILPKVNVHSVNAVCSDEKLKITAKLSLYALYHCQPDETDNENSGKYSAVSSEADFEAEITDVRLKEGQICTAFIDINSVECMCSFDSYGESRIITFETRYTVSATVYDTKDTLISEDVFSLVGGCEPIYEKLSLFTLHGPVHNIVSCTETVHTDIGSLDRISVCFANIKKVTKEKTAENCFAAALCQFEIIGLNTADELISIDFPVTFHVPLENCGIDGADPDFLLTVSNAKADISDGNIKATAEFSLNGIYKLPYEKRAVTSVEMTPDDTAHKPVRNRITVCYPSKDESIWSIAKKHRISPEKIRKANNLGENEEKNDGIIIIC